MFFSKFQEKKVSEKIFPLSHNTKGTEKRKNVENCKDKNTKKHIKVDLLE